MFGNQNLLIDESEDNDFTSKTYNRASTSKPLDKSNREPIIARNLISSESKNSYNANFTRPSSGANFENPASNQTKNYDNFSNPKPNFLDKLKTTNPTFTNPSNLFRPGTSSFTKKEDNYEAKEEVSYQKSNENKGNDFNGMKKPENTTILRAQSSQSQSNMVRQQFLEQQKQKLKDKQAALMQTKTITINKSSTFNFNNPSFLDDKRKDNEDLDYNSLQNVVKQDDREQHEPGNNRKTFNLPGLNKIDHSISFKTPVVKHQEEKLEEYNLEDSPTIRKEDVGLLGRPEKNILKEIPREIEEDHDAGDDVEQQRNSQVKEKGSKSMKYHKEEEEEEDFDAETLKIAKQIKALKEGNKQGEIKITLKGDGAPSITRSKTEKKNEQGQKLKNCMTEVQKEIKEQEGENEKGSEADSDGEEVHVEEEKQGSKNKSTSNKNPSIKIFNHFDGIKDLKEFLINPAPKNNIIQCVIRRERGGWSRIYPKYKLFFSGKGTFLMSGKKRSHNKTSNYLLSLSADDFRKGSGNVLAKVRSNFMGTEFHIYDTGSNPKKSMSFESVRKELAVVTYETNFFGAKGPRKMKALVPDLKEDGESFFEWKPTKADDGMMNYFKSGKKEGVKHLFNKPPKWNEHIGAFVLNFNGRVDKPSVKNFQLVDEVDDNVIYLQFGRIGNEEFTMDYMWPLTCTQAFGICLSSFDYKIACE